jgi:hypothetical protein
MAVDTEELHIVPATEVMRLISKSSKGLRKLEADPDVCFPKKIVINGRKYYRFVDIRNWLNDLQIQSEHAELDFHGNMPRDAAE